VEEAATTGGGVTRSTKKNKHGCVCCGVSCVGGGAGTIEVGRGHIKKYIPPMVAEETESVGTTMTMTSL